MALESWTKSNSFQQVFWFYSAMFSSPITRLRHAWRLNYQGRHTGPPKPCLNRSKLVAQARFHRVQRSDSALECHCHGGVDKHAEHGSKGTRMAEAWTLGAPFAYAAIRRIRVDTATPSYGCGVPGMGTIGDRAVSGDAVVAGFHVSTPPSLQP